MLAAYVNDLSSNPVEVSSFFCCNCLERTGMSEIKRPIKKVSKSISFDKDSIQSRSIFAAVPRLKSTLLPFLQLCLSRSAFSTDRCIEKGTVDDCLCSLPEWTRSEMKLIHSFIVLIIKMSFMILTAISDSLNLDQTAVTVK